jgi:glucokinase
LRPPEALLEPTTRPVPVLEIGGTHVTAALVDLAGGVVLVDSVRRRTLSPSGSATEVLGAVVDCGLGLSVPARAHWGVAIPGPFDYRNGIAMFAGVGKFEALYGVDVGAALRAGLPGPPGSLTFLNDAEAFLWGEWLFGAAAGNDPCVAITLGTGIGSAFLADGEIRQGGAGVPVEGRLDLLRLAGQPLEDVVSARAIESAYQLRTGIAAPGIVHIASQARGGDQVAAEVLRTAFEQLGAVLRPWLQDFGAKVLVVGGSMTGSWDLIGPALLEGIRAGDGTSFAALQVSVATRPEEAALLGAAAFAQRTRGAADVPKPVPRRGPQKASAT